MTTEYTKNFALALPDFRMGPWHDLVNNNMIKLDTLIYGAVSGLDTEVWENDTTYQQGVSVFDSNDGTTWMCNTTHTTPSTGTFADERAAHPTYWVQLLAGFAPRGEWQNNTNYYPYDLAYQSSTGVLALCKSKHVSNPSGTILDDETYWSFLVNFSDIALATAITVSYVPTAPITNTNVQGALDQLAGFIVALNNVNVNQGTDIGNLQTKDTDLQNQINGVNTATLKTAGNQNITGGFSVTSLDKGDLTSFTVNPLQGNYQYGNNKAAITITAPAVDCGVDLLITNTATAGAITMTGFTVNAINIGDPFTTTNGHKFLVSIRRIGGVSTYVVKALQ